MTLQVSTKNVGANSYTIATHPDVDWVGRAINDELDFLSC